MLRRRSLLKPTEPVHVPKRRSLLSMILLSYITALLFYALWLLLDPLFSRRPPHPPEDLINGMLPIGLFVVPIILIGFFGMRALEKRIEAGRLDRRIPEMAWRTGVWIAAGMTGSILGYESLLLLQYGLPALGTDLIGTAFTVNVAVILLVSVAGSAISGRRNARLGGSQQRLLTDEFEAAYRMQQSLLPQGHARLYGYDIAAAMEPAVEIGGDYYDYLTFADGSKGILVADASGKGIPAALVMAKFQGMASALSSYITDPGEFFVGLNDTLRIRLARGRFITVGLVTIDFDDNCRFWRAGHNELLHYSAEKSEVIVRRPPGLALGITHGGHIGTAMRPEPFSIESDDVLLLFSDGLSEACSESGEEFGEKELIPLFGKLCAAGLPARDVRDRLLNELERFVGQAEGQDDVTIVVIRKG